MSCVAALLMTAPGTTLLADDILEGISVSETSEDSSVASVAEESVQEVIGEEMRGTYIKNNICINFSNDIVTKNSIIECKSINREVEDWYFESSLVQCAVYSSLLQKTNGDLVTSKFFSDMGNPVIKTTVAKNIDYLLRFGEDTYNVTVNDADKIVDFILKKAKATYTWDEAKTFDFCYKQKEYETLKQYFNYNRIENYE